MEEIELSMYQKSTLENGIRVLTETLPGHRSISMGILVDTGSSDEAPHQSGLAQLVEHAVFCGTSNRNAYQIARFMDEAGGHLGAFTARDFTCYAATVLDDYFTYALDLLNDILLNSVFPLESLEREKTAILCEIESAGDMPAERAHDLLKSFAWSDHPLGRSIAGRPDTIKLMTREDVVYYVHKHYSPDCIIIAAAGNVDHEDFVAQVRDAFWRKTGKRQPVPEAPPVFHPGVVFGNMPVSQIWESRQDPMRTRTDMACMFSTISWEVPRAHGYFAD
jgi:predicted Zn-dependent peptidase